MPETRRTSGKGGLKGRQRAHVQSKEVPHLENKPTQDMTIECEPLSQPLVFEESNEGKSGGSIPNAQKSDLQIDPTSSSIAPPVVKEKNFFPPQNSVTTSVVDLYHDLVMGKRMLDMGNGQLLLQAVLKNEFSIYARTRFLDYLATHIAHETPNLLQKFIHVILSILSLPVHTTPTPERTSLHEAALRSLAPLCAQTKEANKQSHMLRELTDIVLQVLHRTSPRPDSRQSSNTTTSTRSFEPLGESLVASEILHRTAKKALAEMIELEGLAVVRKVLHWAKGVPRARPEEKNEAWCRLEKDFALQFLPQILSHNVFRSLKGDEPRFHDLLRLFLSHSSRYVTSTAELHRLWKKLYRVPCFTKAYRLNFILHLFYTACRRAGGGIQAQPVATTGSKVNDGSEDRTMFTGEVTNGKVRTEDNERRVGTVLEEEYPFWICVNLILTEPESLQTVTGQARDCAVYLLLPALQSISAQRIPEVKVLTLLLLSYTSDLIEDLGAKLTEAAVRALGYARDGPDQGVGQISISIPETRNGSRTISLPRNLTVLEMILSIFCVLSRYASKPWNLAKQTTKIDTFLEQIHKQITIDHAILVAEARYVSRREAYTASELTPSKQVHHCLHQIILLTHSLQRTTPNLVNRTDLSWIREARRERRERVSLLDKDVLDTPLAKHIKRFTHSRDATKKDIPRSGPRSLMTLSRD